MSFSFASHLPTLKFPFLLCNFLTLCLTLFFIKKRKAIVSWHYYMDVLPQVFYEINFWNSKNLKCSFISSVTFVSILPWTTITNEWSKQEKRIHRDGTWFLTLNAWCLLKDHAYLNKPAPESMNFLWAPKCI